MFKESVNIGQILLISISKKLPVPIKWHIPTTNSNKNLSEHFVKSTNFFDNDCLC